MAKENKKIFQIPAMKNSGMFQDGHTPWNKGKVGVQENYRKGKIGFSLGLIRDKCHLWRGGKRMHKGYVQVFVRGTEDEKYCPHKNWVMPEHRLVVSRSLGRKLQPWEVVHHKNGIKTDNRLENLQIVYRKRHYGEIECPFCRKEFCIK